MNLLYVIYLHLLKIVPLRMPTLHYVFQNQCSTYNQNEEVYLVILINLSNEYVQITMYQILNEMYDLLSLLQSYEVTVNTIIVSLVSVSGSPK